MNSTNEPMRLKSLLSMIVRRHLKRPVSAGPIGRMIEEVRRGLAVTGAPQDQPLEGCIVDRLYHRFFLNGQATVELLSAFATDTRIATGMST